MASSCQAIAHYSGPLIVIGMGIGFMAVGSLPVIVTITLGNKTSATIIGVGFIGFGLLLVLPGVIWCIVRRTLALQCCAHEQLRFADGLGKESSLRWFVLCIVNNYKIIAGGLIFYLQNKIYLCGDVN